MGVKCLLVFVFVSGYVYSGPNFSGFVGEPETFPSDSELPSYTQVTNPVQKVFGLFTNPEKNLDTLNPDI